MDKRDLLPDWITPLDDFAFPQDSVILLHDAHFYLHARRSMSQGNIDIDKLVTVSRHRNVDIIVETQQSFRLDRNIVAEVDAIIFRLPELMQERFERPEVRWITDMAKKAFSPYIGEYQVVDDSGKAVGTYRKVSPEVVKKAFVYSKNFIGMYPHDIPLPSYWSEEISRAYGELRADREGTVRVEKRRDNHYRTMVLPKEITKYDMLAVKGLLDQELSKGRRNLVMKTSTWVKKALGINTHSLRYAFITHLTNKGYPPQLISKITGHKRLEYIIHYTQERAAKNVLTNLDTLG